MNMTPPNEVAARPAYVVLFRNCPAILGPAAGAIPTIRPIIVDLTMVIQWLKISPGRMYHLRKTGIL
jgi:hypothetical protein